MNKVKTNTKKSFWKFIYFPLWETEKKQKLIEEYAENGYMLTKVWGNLFYKFRKRSPKKVKCFISNYKLRRGFNLAPISDFWFYWKTRDLNSCELIFDFDNYSEEFEKYYREINLWRDYVYHPRYMIENVCFALVFRNTKTKTSSAFLKEYRGREIIPWYHLSSPLPLDSDLIRY